MSTLLRWRSIGYEYEKWRETPVAYVPGYEGQKEYFVLQQFDQGQWHDVPVEGTSEESSGE